MKQVECLQNWSVTHSIFLVHYIANNIPFERIRADFPYIAYFFFFPENKITVSYKNVFNVTGLAASRVSERESLIRDDATCSLP